MHIYADFRVDYNDDGYCDYDVDNNEIILSKEIGTSIAYSSTTEHEIKEILSGERWSIVMPITNNVIIEKKSII